MPPAEDPPRRRSSGSHATPRDTPSGRWLPGDFDEGPTPPPVEPSAAVAWQRQRSRVTQVEGVLGRLDGSVTELTRRVGNLEAKDQEMSHSINALHRDTAVQSVKLDAIKTGIDQLTAAAAKGGDRIRNTVQLLIAAAAVLVAVVSIITR